MFIEKLLQIMAEKKASDIFISAGSPISIKIQGNIMPVNPQPVDAEMTIGEDAPWTAVAGVGTSVVPAQMNPSSSTAYQQALPSTESPAAVKPDTAT